MAESPENEDTSVGEAAEETTFEQAPAQARLFLLKSVVRGRNNRTARSAVPGRMPFVQRIAGGRIIVRRARPARITEAVLIANLKEITALVSRHQIEVVSPDGRVIDLETLEMAKASRHSPPPNPPLDSAKNDKNENVGYNVPGSPEGTTLDAELPELLQPSSLTTPEQSEQDPVDALLGSMALPPEQPEQNPVNQELLDQLTSQTAPADTTPPADPVPPAEAAEVPVTEEAAPEETPEVEGEPEAAPDASQTPSKGKRNKHGRR